MNDIDAVLAALNKAQTAHDKAVAASSAGHQPWSQEMVILLAAFIIGFSAIILLLATFLLWRSRAHPSYTLRIFGILTIVTLSALLMVIGYSNEQLTPIIGLFGAVAGYLLGRDSSANGRA
jgi:uncharacterized membrane protein